MSYKNPSRKHRSRLSTPVRLCVAAVAACFIATPVLSNPVNPVVVNGAATFNQVGKLLTVTNSNGAIINWDKFSIKVGETTHFAQTAASSTVLNRVLNDPTAIYGTLSSNGRVWLVNPAGIMVGPGGRVDTAGFVASTLNISNENFLAGRNLFINDGTAKDVLNQGEIRTPAGGSVYLIGSNVSNEGIITTPKGETILAAGTTVSLIDSALPGVKVDITGAEGNSTNLGTITAEAGRIGIAGVIVRNSGQINASSVVSEGGRIFLRASQDAYVDGNGRIITTGTKGGQVEVLGNRVAVTDKAEIDASGENGGGKIMIGGDYQGKHVLSGVEGNTDIQNASISYFGPNASLKADATGVGDGGTVIVWSDDTTRAYGNISARGGALGGDGGFVETSGKRYLDAQGIRVNVGASNGQAGSWLLDPSNINIVASGTPDAAYAGGVFSYGGDVGTVLAGDVNNALGYGSVIIHTDGAGSGNGHITANAVSLTGTGSLTLAAYGGGGSTDGNITIYGSTISVGGFKALAGWNGATTYSGSDVISGTGNINIAGSSINSSGNIDLHAGNDITLGRTTSGPGTWLQSNGDMFVSANNLTLLGGSGGIWHSSSTQGPSAVLYSMGAQTIAIENQILLQAGGINNTAYAGSPMYGGSVAIRSGGSQTISAHAIKVYAGDYGHDNSAEIQAYGGQSITITGTGGLLEVKGGGDGDTSVYGGQGSFNNQARILHGDTSNNETYTGTGQQTITIYGGGTVNVQAGSGTGKLGYYRSDCVAAGAAVADCRGSGNGATLENGIGAQALNFDPAYGGAIGVYGGGAGTNNWAGINNKGAGQTITGNPDITLTGGTGGGAANYGGLVFLLSNDAGIFSKGTGAQTIYGGSITINGGGDTASYGGAGISNESDESLYIATTGNLSMYGGASSAGDTFAGGVYIGNKNGGAIDLQIGGAVYIQAGSGSSAPVLIGSVGGPSNVNIVTGGNVDVIADGSGVAIGSLSASYGATVNINSGGSLSVSGSGTRGVLIGSLFDSGAASLDGDGIAVGPGSQLTANSDLTLKSGNNLLIAASVPVKTYGGAITLVAGWDGETATGVDRAGVISAYGGFTTYGGAFNAYGWTAIELGSVITDAPTGSGSDGGAVYVDASNGPVYVGSISAKGGDASGLGSDGGTGGNVTLLSYGLLTLGSGGIEASGGKGSDGGEGGLSSARQGGDGGQVTLTSTTGNITVNGNITAKGGEGGAGEAGSGSTSYSGGWTSGGSGYQGGDGGQGGSITLTATAGNILLSAGVSLNARGGDGGEGGAGGTGWGHAVSDSGGVFSATGQGGQGGTGGTGGTGGIIGLNATVGGIVMYGGTSLVASGGTGGAGGAGGVGMGYSATSYYGYASASASGGTGGSGGSGGRGGTVSLAGGSGGITIHGDLIARGGTGGAGGAGGQAYVDSAVQSANAGYAGDGGDGGNETSSSSHSISVGSYGGIAFSGTLDTRGGAGGSGEYSGYAGRGGNVVMIAGWDGGYMTTNGITGSITGIDDSLGSIITGGGGSGSGSFTAYAGNSITLGSVNTDGVSLYYGYNSGGNVSMSAVSGSIEVSSISAKGGVTSNAGENGGSGGAVTLQAYGGLTLGSGGIDASGADGWSANEGDNISGGGEGGSGGQVMLTSITGDVAVNGNILANGGKGGYTSGYGSGYWGYGINNGGAAGDITVTASAGSITVTNALLSAKGGDGGNSGSGYAGYGQRGGTIALASDGGITLTGSTLSANGGAGGSVEYYYGYAGYAGRGGSITLTNSGIGNISLTGSALNAIGGTGGSTKGYSYDSGYGSGGNGGSITLTNNGIGNISLTSSSINAYGGDGGSAGFGYSGYAGNGGSIELYNNIAGDITLSGTTTTLNVQGGTGGNSTYGGYSGYSGGAGGSVTLQTANGSVALNNGSLIDARGGIGGAGSNDDSYNGYSADSGGDGGEGGNVTLVASGAAAIISLSDSLITAGGGLGGSGGAGTGAYDGYGGDGGTGGSAGSVSLTAERSIQLVGSAVYVNGGSGGAGGAGVAAGGSIGSDGTGGSAEFTSQYGGVAGGLAIIADVVGSNSLSATVDGVATYGGIAIRNFGAQPGAISIADNASLQSNISFYNSGDLALDGDQTFTASGSKRIESGGILDISTGVTAGDNIVLAGTTIRINAGGYVEAGNNVALIAPLLGGTIFLDGGVTAYGGSGIASSITASNGVSLPYTGIAFVAGNLFADSGGYLKATHTTLGNISGLVTGDIPLNNGAYFDAAKDIDLVLAGTMSTLSLLNGGYFLASPTTIKLDFSNRSSGGLVISGGGGLFVGSIGNIATAGAGLELNYGVAASVAVDPCVTNPLLCKTPTDDKAPSPPDTGKTDPTSPPEDLSKTTGGEKDTFGGEEQKPPEETKKDEQDEKDKKDKKSDEAKDEKKDEKPAAKKVAMCS
ncbi:MAG: filamentous hemagglutinin N-terminal domain-containing protein [Sulfuritalea sp.]|nr:filamentous hemagglutinin N-terminal domain-containing protein [Sulfuritalea sp.]